MYDNSVELPIWLTVPDMLLLWNGNIYLDSIISNSEVVVKILNQQKWVYICVFQCLTCLLPKFPHVHGTQFCASEILQHRFDELCQEPFAVYTR